MKLRSIILVAFALLGFSVAGFSADASSLKPPAGSDVAVVMFEDLECPDCARAYPVVRDAAKSHHIQVVLHDFPLPRHHWSFQAAIFARFFDTKSEKLGDDFRGYIFQNQPQINEDNLQQFVQKFADQNKVPLPFAVDPQGKLKEKVEGDRSLGQKLGLEHTPTIFVIGNSGPGTATPFVEVADRSQLTQIIEDMQRKAAQDKPASAKSKKKAS